MLFSELCEQDSYGAFSEFIPISKAKEINLLHPLLHECYDDFCDCGSEIIISKNLKRYTCCDPKCYLKVGKTLHKLLENFSCKHVGDKTCYNLSRHVNKSGGNYKSHVDLLLEGMAYEFYGFQGAAKDHFRVAQYAIRSSEIAFPDMVCKLGIPSFGAGSVHIFEGMSSVKDLMEKIISIGGVSSFLYSRGVMDSMKAFYLELFLEDIIKAETELFTNKVAVGQLRIDVTITGTIYFRNNWISKDNFLALCNKAGEINRNLRIYDIRRNDAIKTNMYVLSSGEETTKLGVALERESDLREMGVDQKIVYTPDEFYDHLEEQVRLIKESFEKAKETAQGVNEDVPESIPPEPRS